MKLHLKFTFHELSIENDQAGVVKNYQLLLGVDLMCIAQYEARLKAINGEYMPVVWLSTLKENQEAENKMPLKIRESGVLWNNHIRLTINSFGQGIHRTLYG